MGRALGLFIVQCLLLESAHGAVQRPTQQSDLFFNRVEISKENFFMEEDGRQEILAEKVADAIISKWSLAEKNLAAHGMKSKEYIYRKGRTINSVKYIDIDIVPVFGRYFRFDIIYSNGSEFFPETEPKRIESCGGRIDRDGVVKVNIEKCVANHVNQQV